MRMKPIPEEDLEDLPEEAVVGQRVLVGLADGPQQAGLAVVAQIPEIVLDHLKHDQPAGRSTNGSLKGKAIWNK